MVTLVSELSTLELKRASVSHLSSLLKSKEIIGKKSHGDRIESELLDELRLSSLQ